MTRLFIEPYFVANGYYNFEMEGISIIITVAVSLFCSLVEIPTSDDVKEPNFFQRLDRSLTDDEENADSKENLESVEKEKSDSLNTTR